MIILKTHCENLKEELKKLFSKPSVNELSRCSKFKADYQVKKKIRCQNLCRNGVSFATLEQANEELGRFKRIGVIGNISHLKWAAPTVYVNKK